MNNDVVIIDLDRPRVLRFTYTALKTLTSMAGVTMEQIDDMLDTGDFQKIELLVYCGLLKDAREHGETLTVEQIPELLDLAPSFTHIMERVVRAWAAAFPSVEGNQPAAAGEAESGSRSTSTKVSA